MAATANALNSSVATVSRRIHRLENNFEYPIFHKSNNKWKLTKEGHELVSLAHNFASGLSTLHAHDSVLLDHKVEIRLSTVIFLAEEVFVRNISKLNSDHPNISLMLNISGSGVSLAFGEADIAVRLSRPVEGRLIGKRISSIKMSPVQNIHSKSDDWVGLEMKWNTRPEMIMGYNHFGRDPIMRMPSFRAIREVVKSTGLSGIGPTFI